MAQQFLLPCECGHAIPVTAAQAGRTLTCSCSHEHKVPTLGTLRQLPMAAPQGAAKTKHRKRRSPIVAWSGAALAVLLAVAFGAWWTWRTWVPTPDLPTI